MKRPKPKNTAINTKNLADIKNYNKQRNYAVQLNGKAKQEYFQAKEVNLFGENVSLNFQIDTVKQIPTLY